MSAISKRSYDEGGGGTITDIVISRDGGRSKNLWEGGGGYKSNKLSKYSEFYSLF
jgi:hypothetical protein